MSVKKILSLAASTIKLFIIISLINNSNADENNIKYYSNDMGILSLMYHRFNEKKYPSTNIQMDVFEDHIKMIKSLDYNFYDPGNLEKNFNKTKKKKKFLLLLMMPLHHFMILLGHF